MKINELNKPDQLEEGPVWDKVKQLGAGTKGFFQGGATGARAGYNAQGTANQMTGKIKDISMLVLNKWQEFNQAYKMANGGQDAGAEEAVAWFIKFTGGQKPNNPNPPTGDSPAYIQKWLQQEIANTMAQRAMAKVQGELPDITKLNREELLQLRQQLTATGLNEDILNEVDWSKVKNAVAGGAISLAALGLPGLANADAQKMTPEQIRAWVQQSVKNKTPLQAQQIVNKLNVVPTADTPAAATPAPTATPAPVKAEPASPTVDPSVARKAVSTLPPGGASKPAPVADPTPAPVVKAEPKDEPTPQSVKAEPKDEPTPQSVKAEPKDAPRNDVSQNTNLSEFSIKGLRFGMTKDQVAEVLKQNNIGGNLGQGLGRFFGALSGANQSNTVDINFGSLLGVSEGTGMMGELEFSNDGHLHAIMLTPRTDKVAEIAQRLAMKYGQPEVEDKVWQNKIGNKFDNKVYRWKDVGGASIGAILRGNDRDYGMIGIVDSTRLKDAHAKDAENIKKSQGDFE